MKTPRPIGLRMPPDRPTRCRPGTLAARVGRASRHDSDLDQRPWVPPRRARDIRARCRRRSMPDRGPGSASKRVDPPSASAGRTPRTIPDIARRPSAQSPARPPRFALLAAARRSGLLAPRVYRRRVVDPCRRPGRDDLDAARRPRIFRRARRPDDPRSRPGSPTPQGRPRRVSPGSNSWKSVGSSNVRALTVAKSTAAVVPVPSASKERWPEAGSSIIRSVASAAHRFAPSLPQVVLADSSPQPTMSSRRSSTSICIERRERPGSPPNPTDCSGQGRWRRPRLRRRGRRPPPAGSHRHQPGPAFARCGPPHPPGRSVRPEPGPARRWAMRPSWPPRRRAHAGHRCGDARTGAAAGVPGAQRDPGR